MRSSWPLAARTAATAAGGGDIIFVVDDHLTTLMDFRYKRKYTADEGGKGGASLCHGKNAEDLVIKVPLGTVIKDAESGLVIADLSDHTPRHHRQGRPRRLRQCTLCYPPPARSPSLQSPVCPARIFR